MIALSVQILLLAMVADATPDQPVVHFARVDTELSFAVSAADDVELLLFAFGEVIGDPIAVERGSVRLRVPDVRAQTILDLRAGMPPRPILAQIAAYPRDARLWGDAKIDVYALSAPPWFLEWARAVGISVTAFSQVQSLRYGVSNRADERLVVLGNGGEVYDPWAALELGGVCDANVLVLDAPWHTGDILARAIPHVTEHTDAVCDLGNWAWRDLPTFVHVRQPRALWMNRVTLLGDTDHALVEMLAVSKTSRVLIANYLPWDQQLGRTDIADALFVALLREAARATLPGPLDRSGIIHGPDSWPDTLRPVLSRTLQRADAASVLHIVDLRGDAPSPVTGRELQRLLDSAQTQPVLILGDDDVLRRVRGLPELDAKIAKDVPVLWLSSDELPASVGEQERLQRVLTLYRVPIVPLSEDDR